MFTKDPSALLDYTLDWSLWLPSGDAVATATWTVEEVTYLSPVDTLTAATYTVGGSMTAGTYFYTVTAFNVVGETQVGQETAVTLTGSSSSVVLAWPVSQNATGYNIYRGTVSHEENELVGTVNSGYIGFFVDDGTTETAKTPSPNVNTAVDSLIIVATPIPSVTATQATVWVQGGIAGTTYNLTCHLTTSEGRQDSRTIQINVADL